MDIAKHLDKNNLHHAYLLEGERGDIVPEVLKFCSKMNIKTDGNPDFCHITIDNLKINDAFDLRAMSGERAFSPAKKIYLLCANGISLDAQNVLLKMFEEPIENTHFFVVVPDAKSLLKTLVSRFYLISAGENLPKERSEEAEKFIAMSLQRRIDFIYELLPKKDEEGDDADDVSKDSNRTKALKFLDALEFAIHSRFLKNYAGSSCFSHFFKVREFLRMPGSSAKNLMESVALTLPDFQN